MKTAANAIRVGWATRRAWWFTATARTKERFARTALGSFWLGLSNLLSIGSLAFVYGSVFKVKDFSHYVVYLGLGLVVWNTIAGSVQAAPALFKTNAGNIKNTSMHPIFYTLEEWSFQTQTFFQSFSLVLIALSFFQPSLIANFLTVGLLPLLNLILFIYWFPILICLVGAEYEDLFQLIPIVLQLMFLLSPVLYQKEALGSLGWTADINPLYRVMSGLRHALIAGEDRLGYTFIILGFNILGILVSIAALEKGRKRLPFLV
jgi:lipopolysaccharide transport system permease protein